MTVNLNQTPAEASRAKDAKDAKGKGWAGIAVHFRRRNEAERLVEATRTFRPRNQAELENEGKGIKEGKGIHEAVQ